MVNLLLDGDEDALSDPGAIRTLFDCACGTGGMLSPETMREVEQAVAMILGIDRQRLA